MKYVKFNELRPGHIIQYWVKDHTNEPTWEGYKSLMFTDEDFFKTPPARRTQLGFRAQISTVLELDAGVPTNGMSSVYTKEHGWVRGCAFDTIRVLGARTV